MKKLRADLSLLAVATMLMMSSTVQAQSSRIASSSDQGPSVDLDIWLSIDDGSQQYVFSAAPLGADTHRPSICNDGRRIFFDDYNPGSQPPLGNLWAKNTNGTAPAQQVLDCWEPDGAPTCFGTPVPDCGPHLPNPCGDLPFPGGPCNCAAVACGSPLPGYPATSRILFVYMNSEPYRFNILMATWDASSGTLSGMCKLTNDGGCTQDDETNHDPAWCGNNHMVFSRTAHEEEGVPTQTGHTLCTRNVPTETPTGAPNIFHCHNTNDGLHERYPSCGMVNGEWRVAYAKQKTGSLHHRICTVALDQTTFAFIPGSEVCTPIGDLSIDWTRPTWAPGGAQLAFAANMDALGSPTLDYEIFVINSGNLPTATPVLLPPDDLAEDNDPDWGPAPLGP